ncbi:hypothetical protein C8R46DRAFT_1074248, partial [Mycena filopes]
MSTFSAFRLAARTLLHPGRPTPLLPCQNAIALHHHARFKSKRPQVSLKQDNALVKMSLTSLLNSINLKDEWVELIAEEPFPIVRRVNKKAALLKSKEDKLKLRESSRKHVVKEVQLTWWSEQSDLDHKIARVRSHLEMGARVDIVFSSKPNTPPPPMQTRKERVQKTIELLEEFATPWKPVEWRKSMAAIYFQGKGDVAEKTEGAVGVEAKEGAAKEMKEGEIEVKEVPAKEVAKEVPVIAVQEAPVPRRPLPPHMQPKSQPKGYIDLTSLGYLPPARSH